MTIERECPTHGTYQAEEILAPFEDVPALKTGCPGCAKVRSAEEVQRKASAEQQMRSRRLKALRAAAGIPARYADASLDDYQTAQQGQAMVKAVCAAYADGWPEQLRKGGSLVLCGMCGTGKTHLACAIGNTVMAQHLATVAFGSATVLLRQIKDTYRPNSSRSESELLSDMVSPDLLIIDEIGAQRGTEHELQLLFEIINQRYAELRPVILLSNLTAEELEKFLGERVMDRFRECGAVLAFNWGSYRATARQANGAKQQRGSAHG